MTTSQPLSDVATTASLVTASRLVVNVDVVILTLLAGELQVLLRRTPAVSLQQNEWSIPGDFVPIEMGLEDAARHELESATHLHDIYLEQLYTFGDPKRDPRTRVITVVYFALVDAARLQIKDIERDGQRRWFSMYQLPPLILDHQYILDYTLQRMRGKLEYTTIGFQLLAPEFTLRELQIVYEAILGRKLDKRNFRKKILSTNILDETAMTKMEGPHRPARLYRFKADAARV